MNRLLDRFGHRSMALLPAYARAPGVASMSNDLALLGDVAVINVMGVLTCGASDSQWGELSYNDIARAFRAAIADTEVGSVVLVFDSPGGTVAGCFDLADEIHAARGTKPLHAILAEDAYSAAYALASSCDRVTVPRTGGTGSIGVMMLHIEMSRAMRAAGVTPTIIKSAEHKAEANQFEPLSKDALAREQAAIDAQGNVFVETVARNRKMTTAAVRATKGEAFLGGAGVSAGLADAVRSPDAAFSELFTARVATPRSSARKTKLSAGAMR